ncbi:MAG: MarR family transcriptional regulator [Ignavibacteria bacterium]|nr:MarR family transcriptional regulator [Ignavibacteria bacterium]MCC7158528.1 MarR family transcriptional regulator [Ignavibacteria bacterium]
MNRSIVELIFELKFACLAKEESIREKLDISPAEYRGIISMQPGKAVSCMELSAAMGLSRSRGSRVVDKLIKNGFLKEAEKSDDKRVFNVILTKAGRKALREINHVMKDCESAILKDLPEKELKSFTLTLHKISEIVKP